MAVVQCSQNVSVAHRPKSGAGLGNNLTVKLAVDADGEFSFDPLVQRVKSRLDHRCLFEDEPRFLDRPSTLEAVTQYLAEDLFQQSLPGARWVSVAVSEMDRFRCVVEPGQPHPRLNLRHRNLQLEIQGPLNAATGEIAPRADIIRRIDQVFASFAAISGETEAQWCERLFIVLKRHIPALCEVTIDLGRHRSIRLAEGLSPLR